MLNKIQVGLRGKINVMVVLVGVFCTAVIAIVGTSKSSSAIKKQVSNQMTASSKMMKAKLDDYFKQTQIFTRRLTANRLVEGLFIAFEGAYYGGAFKDNSDNNILSSTYLSNDKLYGTRVRNMAQTMG